MSQNQTKDQPAAGPRAATSIYSRIMGFDMVDLYVGPKRELFRVYKKRLCTAAPYFAQIFTGDATSEVQVTQAEFPDDTVESFDILLIYIIRNAIPQATVMPDGNPGGWKASIDFVAAYCLAEKVSLTNLMDQLMDRIREVCKFSDDYARIATLAYTKSPVGSPLRRFIIRLLVFKYGHPHVARDDASIALFLNPEITKDFLDCFQQLGGSQPHEDPRVGPNCLFHKHGPNQLCPSKE